MLSPKSSSCFHPKDFFATCCFTTFKMGFPQTLTRARIILTLKDLTTLRPTAGAPLRGSPDQVGPPSPFIKSPRAGLKRAKARNRQNRDSPVNSWRAGGAPDRQQGAVQRLRRRRHLTMRLCLRLRLAQSAPSADQTQIALPRLTTVGCLSTGTRICRPRLGK